jgi:hypothetical protein
MPKCHESPRGVLGISSLLWKVDFLQTTHTTPSRSRYTSPYSPSVLPHPWITSRKARRSKVDLLITMKPSTCSSLRSLRSSTLPLRCIPTKSPRTSTHNQTIPSNPHPFSTTRPGRDEDNDAESSTSRSNRPGKGEPYPEESVEEAFRRNLREVQAFRRRKESLRTFSILLTLDPTPHADSSRS